MTPYVQQYIPTEDLTLFAQIKHAIEQMPNINLGNDEEGAPIILSCHMLARAVAQIVPQVRVRDGLFVEYYDHSWIETSHDNIIDLYPVAIVGGPIMIDYHAHILRKRLYKPATLSHKAFHTASFIHAVELTAHALRTTLTHT